jgi:hypothetical protein
MVAPRAHFYTDHYGINTQSRSIADAVDLDARYADICLFCFWLWL